VQPKKTKERIAWQTLHYFWIEFKRYKWLSLLTMVLTPIVVFIRAVLAPLLFANLIEKVSAGLSGAELWRTATTDIVAFFTLFAISKTILEPLRLWATWKLELLGVYDLADICFKTVIARSMQFHNDRFSGSLVNQVNKFIWSFERFVDVAIWDVGNMISYIALIVIVLAREAGWFAAALVIFVIIYGIVAFVCYRKLAPLSAEEAEAENRQTGQLADSMSNVISVKSYSQEDYEERRFDNFTNYTFHDIGRRRMHGAIGRDIAFGVVQIGITAMILAFLIFGQGWLGISVSTLILIVTYSQKAQDELWELNGIFKDFNKTFGDAYEMTVILDTPNEVVDIKDAYELEVQNAAIDFHDVSFKHKDAKEAIFENFSLQVQPGERVGLVGVSGSGKTTLTKLLLRFADVDEGEISISEQDIKRVTQNSLRKNIAYVPQETSLFHRSIAENIAYGRPDATIDEIKQAARLANADEFISDLPGGYETLVGERGVKLSGGQRQRIAIARAILKDAPILVLDEATSALDSESEALIQEALVKLMHGRTSIVIAHRLSTVASLDRIVVLENGKIVEQGKHDELLKRKDGVYKKLWDRQSGAFIQES